MAETLETIYLNNALGNTELSDGEHTILTTDANTRYVLKDLYVKNTEILSGSNTYLELNGHNVGHLKTNATGSLIVGPNSTLKIKTTDFPAQVIDQRDITTTPNNNLFVKQAYKTATGFNVTSEAGTVSAINAADSTSATDALYSSSINATHYSTSDSNSSQYLYYYTSGSSANAVQNASYTPYGLSATSLYGRTAWRFSGSTLQYKVLTTNPTTGTFTSASLPLNASFTPFTSSSSPRGDCHHGYFFYIPNSGYNQDMYAINLTTGAFFRILFNTAYALSATNFTVGYIPSSNRFVVYRHNQGTNQMMFDILPVTKTYMDTYNTPGLNTLSASLSSGTIAFPKAINTSTFGAFTLGYDYLGNVTYKSSTTGNPLITMDRLGTTISEETSFSLNGTSYSIGGNGITTRRARILSAGEITSLGLASPSFGVQILGVKSENV